MVLFANFWRKYQMKYLSKVGAVILFLGLAVGAVVSEHSKQACCGAPLPECPPPPIVCQK